jgi:signal transduction histidine kinase
MSTDFAGLFARLAIGCGLYKPTITLLTAVTTGVLAGIIFYLYRTVLHGERWAKFFSGAFGIFTLQYVLQTAIAVIEKTRPNSPFITAAPQLAQALCSPCNNLCFLAAARLLLNKKVTIPLWAFLVALATVISESFPLPPFWGRLPDAVFSSYCLWMLGRAFFINLRRRSRNILPGLNLVGAGLYGLVNLSLAFNPWIANGNLWPALRDKIKTPLPALQAQFGLLAPLNPVHNLTPLKALDSLVFAVAFLLKISLFLGALFLIIRRLLIFSPRPVRGLLNRITQGRGKYLDAEGVLETLGESFDADATVLFIRAPKTHQMEIEWRCWLRPGVQGAAPRGVMPLPTEKESIVGWIMRTGKPFVLCPDLERDQEMWRRFWPLAQGMRSFVAVGIRYHGAIIACLHLEWGRPHGYSMTTVQRVLQVAEMLGPVVHSDRQLSALDQLASRFREPQMRPDRPEKERLKNLIEAVHDTLSARATGCRVEAGFNRFWIYANDYLSGVEDGIFQDLDPREQLCATTLIRKEEPIGIETGSLDVQGAHLGDLLLLIDEPCDPSIRPSLADDDGHRRTVASLLTDSILSVFRDQFAGIVSQLQVDLNLAADDTLEPWFRCIEEAAQAAGVLWVYTSPRQNQEPVPLGPPWAAAFARESEPKLPPAAEWIDTIHCLSPLQPVGEARSVLILPLAGSLLWLGIGRQDFSRELSFSSPWKAFLQELARTADSALVRREKQRLQLEASQLESVATGVETTSLLVHTLGNDANTLLQGTERLQEMLANAGVSIPPNVRNRAASLVRTAQSFQNLALAFKQSVPQDERHHIPLAEAIERVRALHGDSLRSRSIHLEDDIPAELIIGVPLDVGYIVLVTLITNAAEAIRRSGAIRLQSAEEADRILCHVDDNGSGIKEDLRKKIFEPGFSTKRGGTGLGIPLARNALRRRQGDLVLGEAPPPFTTRFTILFPQ